MCQAVVSFVNSLSVISSLIEIEHGIFTRCSIILIMANSNYNFPKSVS